MHVPGGNWGGGAAVAALFAVIVLGTAHEDAEILEGSTPAPQVVTLADLARGATGANRHVTVTAIDFGRRVIHEKDGRWDVVWMPVHPAGDRDRRRLDLVVRSFRIRDQAALLRFEAQEAVTGILSRGVDSEVGEVLEKSYPGLDRVRLRVLTEGRSYPSRRVVQASRIAGGTLVVIALVCAVQAWRTR